VGAGRAVLTHAAPAGAFVRLPRATSSCTITLPSVQLCEFAVLVASGVIRSGWLVSSFVCHLYVAAVCPAIAVPSRLCQESVLHVCETL
jgi:hypothetical protein